ncbi:HNH endonuclease [Clostridium beijerinckii]|uniref:HNH endonuclease n=1 Tax=Clostridium beijerinckii TaxID=1520 RepID=UPI0003D2B5C9|nr:HNH endonuclease [Clostridium beijerinckii]
MDKDIYGRLKYFEENFDIIKNYHLEGSNEIFLGNTDNKVCRFCGKKEPEVTFEKKAHAIPELLGNKNLFTYYECDNCNGKFCKNLEKHLASFLGISRTLLKVKGKKRIPKYEKGDDEIYVEDGRIIIKTSKINSVLKTYNSDKKMEITTIKDRYIPIAVYKCFTKMAISIISDEELEKIDWTIEWVSEKKHKKSRYSIQPLLLYSAFTPGPSPYTGIDLFLFRRKKLFDYKVPLSYAVPYIIFVIRFKSFVYQIYIEDNSVMYSGKTNRTIKYMSYPGAYDNRHMFGETKYGVNDVSSKELTKSITENFEFKYEDMIENEEIKKMAEKYIHDKNKSS